MHLLLVVLLASLVHLSTSQVPGERAVSLNLKDGFPDGTLLTVYLKFVDKGPTMKDMLILLGDCLSVEGCLYFKLGPDQVASSWQNAHDPHVSKFIEIKPSISPQRSITPKYWRFDLYKISDKLFPVFIQGFEVGIRTKLDSSAIKIKKVQITPLHVYNFDADNVYVMVKYPRTSMYTPPAKLVTDAFDSEARKAAREKKVPRTDFKLKPIVNFTPSNGLLKGNMLAGFPVGKKIRLSALMMPNVPYNDPMDPADYIEYESIYFYSEDETWSFGISNMYKWENNIHYMTLRLFTGAHKKDTGEWTKMPGSDPCIDGASTTNIMHVKLSRPKRNNIKMRVYYAKDMAGGVTCELTIDDNAAKHLDKPLKVQGDHSAVLLHFVMF